MTVVSGNVRLMRILVGFPGERASKDNVVPETAIFSAFASYIFENFRDKANIIIIAIWSPSSFH